MIAVHLTPAQVDEVTGLLSVCSDDFANGDRSDRGWGFVQGRILFVTDPVEAVDDLEWRARYCEEEGYVSDRAQQGAATARSLRRVIDQIKKPKCDCGETGVFAHRCPVHGEAFRKAYEVTE